MRRFLLWTTTAAAARVLPAAAFAAVPGFAVSDVDLHAGPGGVYPVVDTLPAGARVRIDGCIGRYAWCNVSWRGIWGWVPADELQALYRGRRVVVLDYGPEIGLPIIGFSVDTYWNRHYRHRGFYARIRDFDRGRYAHGAVGVSGRNATVGTGVRQNRSQTLGGPGVSAPNATRNGRNATVGAGAPRERGLRNETVGTGRRNTNAAIQNQPRPGAMRNEGLRNAPAASINAAPARPRETTGAAPSGNFGGRGGGGGPVHAAPAAPAAPSVGGGAPHAAGGGDGGGAGGHGGGDHRR